MKKMITGLMACLFLIGCGCAEHYSEGERVGVVTKISKKGILFKSWQASALIALPSSVGGNIQPEQFNFTVDPAAVEAVQNAAASGKRVRMIYRQWGMAPITIDNDHIVYQIQDAI